MTTTRSRPETDGEESQSADPDRGRRAGFTECRCRTCHLRPDHFALSKGVMRWSLRRNPEPKPAPEPTLPEAEIHSSVGFNIAYNQIRGRRKLSVLDLGSAYAWNLEFLSQCVRSLHIEIEDLYETLSSFDFFDPREPRSYDAVYRYLFPYGVDTRFDLILGWDLFNYLEELELAGLIKHLDRFCYPGTLLFSMISTNRYIPERPIRFPDRRFGAAPLRVPLLAAAPFAPIPPGGPEPDDAPLPLFSSFRLRNGFKEYIFSFHGQS